MAITTTTATTATTTAITTKDDQISSNVVKFTRKPLTITQTTHHQHNNLDQNPMLVLNNNRRLIQRATGGSSVVERKFLLGRIVFLKSDLSLNVGKIKKMEKIEGNIASMLDWIQFRVELPFWELLKLKIFSNCTKMLDAERQFLREEVCRLVECGAAFPSKTPPLNLSPIHAVSKKNGK